MKRIEDLLTPRIKSEGVTYKELTRASIPVQTFDSDFNKVIITSDSAKVYGKGDDEIRQGKNYISQLDALFDGKLPECEFEFFSPAFKYRGFLIDVCRHYMPVEELKRIINIMSLAGYNYFHWHLTDDQGWRFAVPGYDKLESISSRRLYDEYHNYSMEHIGLYSEKQMREIVAFCNERGMCVIPEIETPGHATALLAAYPEFGCTGKKLEVETHWGIFEDVMNPASEQLMAFLDSTIKYLSSVFPGPYIHIGGDECPHKQWLENEGCMKLMKEHGFKDTMELQGWFTSKVASIVTKYGKRAIGWDEVVDAPEIDKSVVVMSWRGLEGAKIASDRGHDVILCPQQGCYLDRAVTSDVYEPWQWSVGQVKDCIDLDISMSELSEKQRSLVMGAQCNLWAEQIHNGREAELMLFPRALVLADNIWLGPNKNWEKVCKRKKAIGDLCWALNIVCSPCDWTDHEVVTDSQKNPYFEGR